MAGSADRPVPRAHGVDPGERLEVLRELLTVERERLANALRLERERSIVFPETTVIIKDIERLLVLLAGKADGAGDDGGLQDGNADMADLLAEMAHKGRRS